MFTIMEEEILTSLVILKRLKQQKRKSEHGEQQSGVKVQRVEVSFRGSITLMLTVRLCGR